MNRPCRTAALLLLLVLGAGPAASAQGAEASLEQRYAQLSAEERLALVRSLGRAELGALMAEVPMEDLLALGRARVTALGTYRYRFTKEERVGGKMTGPQQMEVLLRPDPFAVRADVTGGPGKGRRILYSHALRPKEMRVREPGLLSIVGANWIDIDSRLTRRETRHPITNMGFAPLTKLLQQDFDLGRAGGGHKRVDDGLDKAGSYCMTFTPPAGVSGLYASKAHICVRPEDALLTRIDVWDEAGLLERLTFEVLEEQVKTSAATFTPEAAGL